MILIQVYIWCNNSYFIVLAGTLQELKVLILQSNKFYTVIQEPEKILSFSSCTSSIALITDLQVSSHQSTSIVGMIWKFDESQLAYMQPGLLTCEILAVLPTTGQYPQRHHSLGQYVRRKIPASIANLEGLHCLDLSRNILWGHIPSALGSLIMLEYLDLSNNMLSG